MPSSFLRYAACAALLLVTWSIPAILMALQSAADQRMEQRAIPFLTLVLRNLPRWMLWAALTPLIITLAKRVPIERHKLARSLSLHLAAAAVCTILYTLIWVWQFRIVPENRQWPLIPVVWVMLPVGLLWTAGIYTSIVALTRAVLAERQKLTLERQLAETRLDMLRHQLQPHFFFNTLHAVGGLIRLNQNRDAIAMIARLGELMREALSESNQAHTSLHRELELLDLYLEIQRIRFPDRLEVRKSIAPDVLAAQVPVMLLQPLAENAFDHGIGPRPEGGWIELTAERSDEQLHVTIRNNGARLKEDYRQGTGLRNTVERLRALYGERARFQLANEADGTVSARVALPWATSPSALSNYPERIA